MKAGRPFRIGMTLAALPWSTVQGHHASYVTYDVDRVIEITGEISRVLWRNPHIRFTLASTDRSGEDAEWDIEGTPVTRLTRWGLSAELLRVGDRVSVAGHPAKRPGVNQMRANNLLLPDGREVLLYAREGRWTTRTIGGELGGVATGDRSLGIFRVWTGDAGGFQVRGGDYPLTAAARAARAAWNPLEDNPFVGCIPKGMPTIMGQPNPLEFVNRGDEILLRIEEYDTVRVISMRLEGSEQARPATALGYSVGRWDGETLVVTTAGINWPYSFDQRGIAQSDDVEIIERFTVSEDGSRLDLEMTVVDPAVFAEPVVATKSWSWVPGAEVLPFRCAEG